MTAARIGFAIGMNIDDERKSHVLALLQDAEGKESAAQESVVARALTVRTPQQRAPSELPESNKYDEGQTPMPPPSCPPPPRPSDTVASIAALASSMTELTRLHTLFMSQNDYSASVPHRQDYFVSPAYETSKNSRTSQQSAVSAISPPSMPPRPMSFVEEYPVSMIPPRSMQLDQPLSILSTQELDRIKTLTCQSCKDAGLLYPTMTCESCRRAIFQLAYANQPDENTANGTSGDVAVYEIGDTEVR